MSELKVKLKKELIVGKNEDGSNKTIKELTLREPTAGDFRGLSFKKLGDVDVETISTLISRTSRPALAPAIVSLMSVQVFSQLAEAVYSLINGEEEEGKKLEPTQKT